MLNFRKKNYGIYAPTSRKGIPEAFCVRKNLGKIQGFRFAQAPLIVENAKLGNSNPGVGVYFASGGTSASSSFLPFRNLAKTNARMKTAMTAITDIACQGSLPSFWDKIIGSFSVSFALPLISSG